MPWEKRSRLLAKYPELAKKERSLDVLLNVDSGGEVGFDGEGGTGALEYFERLCDGFERKETISKRDPVAVLNW